MTERNVDALLDGCSGDVDRTFRLDGERRPLSWFDGVVADDEDARFFEWAAISMSGETAVELRADGVAHVHDVSYFVDRVNDGRYTPAIRREGEICVATDQSEESTASAPDPDEPLVESAER